MSVPLTFLITHHRYLPLSYAEWQIEALNRQSCKDFQVIYLHQGTQAQDLHAALARAQYRFQVIKFPYPELVGVCCWDLVRVVGDILQHSVFGAYWTYLHQECLPAPDFVQTVLDAIPAAEACFGTENIYRVNQLRCPLRPEQLQPHTWWTQLQQSHSVTWIERRPYQRKWLFQLRSWSEDAFVLPVSLCRHYRLFSAVTFPLWFQDLFDLFLQLEDRPWFRSVNWLHLGYPVIYHLNHPRAFAEYRRTFLQAVRKRPDLFGHLALFELAQEDFDYREGFDCDGERLISTHLHRFVHYMRYSPRGTMTLWLQCLDQLWQ